MKYKFLRISLLSALAVLFGGTALGAFLAASETGEETIFSATVKSQSAAIKFATGTWEITEEYATIAGGKMYAVSKQAEEKELIKAQNKVYYFGMTNNDTYFKVELDQPLAVGDVISAKTYSRVDTELGLFLSTEESRPQTCETALTTPIAEKASQVDFSSYTITEGDGLVGVTSFNIFRSVGKTVYFNDFKITRAASSEESAESVGTYTMSILPTTIMGEKTQEKLDIQVEVKKIGEKYWLESEYFNNLTIPFTYNAATKLATFEQTYITTTLDEGFEANPHLWSAVFVFNGSFTEPQPTYAATFDPETGFAFGEDGGLAWFASDSETTFNPNDTYKAFYVLPAASEDETIYGDASIEGEWNIVLNGHYAGDWSLGEFTGKFTAALDGNTVKFTSADSQFHIVAEFTAENTLTFNLAAVGDPATLIMTQNPYTDGTKVSDVGIDPENFVFESFTATYDPKAGTITFPKGSGLAYGPANAEGKFSNYEDAFDFVSASKAAADVTVTHTWDFTKWSDETVAYLKADAAESAIEGWSDIEKQADAEAGKGGDTYEASKDNCFWAAKDMQTNENGELVADGSIIKELAGLKFLPTGLDSRNLAIAVNYPTTSLGDYKGGSYLWLGGKEKLYFVIPNVKGGTTIKMGVESHKSTDPRGVELYIYDGEKTEGQLLGTDGNAVAAPTVYEEQEWVVPAGEPVDIVVKNTNGCHIYFIDAELAPAASEGDYADASIEGEWEIALNDHYAGQSSLGAFTGKFNATLNGNTVTFEDLTDKYNIVAKFTAKNTLTFNVAIAGNPEAMYPLTQKPYTDGSKVSNLSENPEDFVFESFIATYNPEAGTITFPEGSGILYGAADTEGVFQNYDAAFDFVSASKAAAEPSYKVVGEYTLPVLSTDITGDKSGEAENVKIEVRNNGENYWIAEVGTTNYFKGQTVPFTYNEETSTAQFDESYAGEIEGKHTLFAAFIYKDGNEYIEIQPSVAVGFNPSTGFEWKGYFGFGWFVTDAEFTPTGEIYTAFYVSTTEESNFADASIEGEWEFTLNDHYVGEWSLGTFTGKFNATLNGNTVTFEDLTDKYNIVAEFTAKNTLIFKLAIVGNPGAMYPFTQNPFVASPEGTVDDINPEDFTFQSFIATYNPEAGTITFPEGSGLAYGNANSEGIITDYETAFDFVSASKAATEPSYKVVGTYTLPVLSTDITGDKSGEAENVKIEVRNNGENYWIAEVGTTNYFKGQTISFTYNEETATAQFDESYVGEIEGKHTWFAAFIYEDGKEYIEIQPTVAAGFNPSTGFEWKGNFGFGWFMTEDAEFNPTSDVDVYAVFYVSTQDITDGIDAIDANSAKAVYYDLNGRRVESPKAGIYIKKTGNKIQKIVVE